MSPRLDDTDRALLAGDHGAAAACAMRLMVRYAEAVGAPHFIACTGAHIDGCLYHGEVNLDFVERFVALKGRVRVPTTLNVGSVDLIHPELFIGTPALGTAGARLMRAHEELGCVSTFTCAPYQTLFRPRFGEQVAWGESNAIVFANSVIGARTERYGDFLDLAAALTARVPFAGLHVEANRRATAVLEIDIDPAAWDDGNLLAVAIGHQLGARADGRVVAITGALPRFTEDDLKALGAVSASSGGVGLFHIVGQTPEAPTLDGACHGERAPVLARLDEATLRATVDGLSTVPVGTRLSAVCLGTPHFSLTEFEKLMPLLDGTRLAVDLYINTGRDVFAALTTRGWDAALAAAGVTVVLDTCTYVTSIVRDLSGAVMTNSGKWAHYAPGNLDIDVAFGSLADCVASARAGRVVRA